MLRTGSLRIHYPHGVIYLSDGLIEEASPIVGILNLEPPTAWWGLLKKSLEANIKLVEGSVKLSVIADNSPIPG